MSRYVEAFERIKQAKAEGSSELDLMSLGLEEVPLEVFDLKKLKHLNLERNPLSLLPAEIGQLQDLQSLVLSRSNLSSLPGVIGQLQGLKSLGLSRTKPKLSDSRFGRAHHMISSLPFVKKLSQV